MPHLRASIILWTLFVCVLLGIIPGFSGGIQSALAQTGSENPQPSGEEGTVDAADATLSPEEPVIPLDAPSRNYLFVHDTSKNMRKKKRIARMQNTIRRVLSNLPPTSRAGLQAFGHRFSLDGPDFCTDSEIVIPIEVIGMNKEDIYNQLNFLSNPQLGGGAPVGMTLRQSFDALKGFEEPKEIFFNLIDLQECPNDRSLTAIHSACEVPDLHLTLIGMGLKRDFQTLQEAKVEQLGCVDVINITTPEESDRLPNRLLTRLSLQFKNSEGESIDPQPGEKLTFTLSRQGEDGDVEVVREKFKDAGVRGSSVETVGLEEGMYLLDLEYQGRQLRSQKAITITDKHEAREILHLGKMLIEVTDFNGEQLEAPLVDDLQITLFDAGTPIRTVSRQNATEFDLLPGNQYKVQVSYTLGGELQTVEAENLVAIREGNHKDVSIPLPIGSLSGRILDMDGQPASQVEIHLSAEDGRSIRAPRFTDKDGRYSFQDLSNGLYRLYLKKAGYKEDMRPIIVVGGRKNRIENLALFRGIEIQISSISGEIIDDAEVMLIHKDSGERIPVDRRANIYRNVREIQPGDYLVSVTRDGYKPASQEVSYAQMPPFVDVPFRLPYYITISGNVLNAKHEGVSEAQLEFHSQHSSPELPEGQETVSSSADGTFQARLTVNESGREQVSVVWYDSYNQRYSKDLEFSLPQGPQALDLGTISLAINFLQLSLTNIIGEPSNADSLLLTHRQSGQTGISMQLGEEGQYESLALLDGDYSLRVMKRGYQDVEHQFSIQGGDIQHVSLMLHNYVTITGTVTDGKQNRVSNALIEIAEKHCALTGPQAIVTGKDGRFQTTLLVKTPASEGIRISWKSPESGKEYQISREFELSGTPVEKLKPHNLGNYELPANFIRIEVQDVFGRGLPGVDVQFMSRQGDITRAIELGNGNYESLDLHDGYYNITLTKSGYKENILISDIAVGENKRNLDADQLQLPHYATVTGTVFNGKYEGMPNVELFFGGEASEQLESCRTDQHGKFSTTLLVTGSGKEQWKAIWEEADNFSSSGVFTLPVRPHDVLNLGEIRLPVNFVSIPVQDVRGKLLSEVTLSVTAQNERENAEKPRFTIEELGPGLYQIQNLPDGQYRVAFEKSGYELGKAIDIKLQGGEDLRQAPVQLGYYVTIAGKTIDGRAEAVPNANVRFKGLHSILQQTATEETADREQENGETERSSTNSIRTDERGRFTARLLVTSPGIEELESDWAGKFASSFQLDLSDGPGIQHITLKLPINFIAVNARDLAGVPLDGARVTLTPQSEDQLYVLEEHKPGVYQNDGIPDGSYDVQVSKDQYESRSTILSVQTGESREADFTLKHYVTVKGQVFDGKREGISAAVIAFANLKTETNEKIFSGTDGVVETQVLVKELGRESGKISWDGKNGSYSIPFLIELPSTPGEIILPEEQTVLPINYVSVEVKSVASTGIAGATVRIINQSTKRLIDARDNKNGNYSGHEIPDGIYDISVTKDKYESVTIKDVHLEGGVYKSDLSIPRFSHYITLSGVVVNGKQQGVPNAVVSIREPKGVQDVAPFTTRDDGSFTLHALVIDVSSETLEVVWNDSYSTELPLKLPLLPEDVQLKDIRMPINFVSINVQDIYGKAISGASVSFAQKHSTAASASPSDVESLAGIDSASPLFFAGSEIAGGLYESPELPDNEYLIVVTKEDYVQKDYRDLSVIGGVNVSAKPLSLPHVITIKGRVVNGKGKGVPGTVITIAENNSERSRHYLESGESGYFSERLQITGRGKENLKLLKEGSVAQQERRFSLTQDFTPLKEPGEQEFGDLRLPINFIPVQVYDVAGRPIDDATVSVRPSNARQRRIEAEDILQAVHLGEGRYEARNLNDDSYIVSAEKEGYEPQEASTTLSAGEVATGIPFVLPHYVLVKGIVTTGKGDGLPGAILEFAQENSRFLPLQASQEGQTQQPSTAITNIDGQFTAELLVTQSGKQQVNVGWNDIYVKQFSFSLPEKPEPDYTLKTEIRLPINFAPFRITNILDRGLAGVDITLQRVGTPSEEPLLAHPLGDGYYEARELLDGTYIMTIHKEGYQEVTGDFSVNGGEQSPGQHFALPHYVSIVGKVVNGKGQGVEGATIHLKGHNSSLLKPGETLTTETDGNFKLDVLVMDSESNDFKEHLDISWHEGSSDDSLTFAKSYDFLLPTAPRVVNLGALALPANFFPVQVKDASGKSLTGATVTFIDEKGTEFPAKELSASNYEGQNLPDGVYTVQVSKKGYKADRREKIQIADVPDGSSPDIAENLSFKLPYYVEIAGTGIDGKGQTLNSGMTLSLKGQSSQLLPDSISFGEEGSFKARLLVTRKGREQLQLAWQGEYGAHLRDISFILPDAPQLVDFQRLSLPVNFIPIEIKDLQGYGLSGATVTLYHIESESTMTATDLGDGQYEGQYLPDGSYEISITKDGYKASEHILVTVAEGLVSEKRSFLLRHYVNIIGMAINGNGEGVSDPVIEVEKQRSEVSQVSSEVSGEFKLRLEVKEVGNERIYLDWKHKYRLPVIFKLPERPGTRDLGEIRLPINFLSIFADDISGSTLPGVTVLIEEHRIGFSQILKTDESGSCRTDELPNGRYQVSLSRNGYQSASQTIQIFDGRNATLRFTLPHYVLVKGQLVDIMRNMVGGADIVFEEFFDDNYQKIRMLTDPENGQFEQRLLIDDPAFLERQKGHFSISKDGLTQEFTFKIPSQPEQVLHYKTLLFPIKYLTGKVVDADIQTVPVPDAEVLLTPISRQFTGPSRQNGAAVDNAALSEITTNSLGEFTVSHLLPGEYKVSIHKEGYLAYEDFIRISGLLQEQEFALRKTE